MSFMQQVFDPNRHTKYTPRNLEKYVGTLPIISRSSYEFQFMRWCDFNEKVKRWTSESVQIQYFDPGNPEMLTKRPKKRTYYPDFLIQLESNSGQLVTYLVEIKPKKETIPPKGSSRKSKLNYLKESQTFMTNRAKWNAAQQFCKLKGWKFLILTEEDLFKKK